VSLVVSQACNRQTCRQSCSHQSLRKQGSSFVESHVEATAVHILASHRHGTLYVGVTSDLVKRVWQHREHVIEGFTAQHAIIRLIWYETHDAMESAILREKRLKAWKRQWKLELIESNNPYWLDLWPEISGCVNDTGFLLSQE
jgi:putative endonuclease